MAGGQAGGMRAGGMRAGTVDCRGVRRGGAVSRVGGGGRDRGNI